MGLLSNKISRDDLKPGDHIYSWRSYIFSHHGIYVGDGNVIHFTRGGGLEIETGTFLDKIIVSSVPKHGGDNNPCPNCGDQSILDLDGVISSCLDCFLAGGNLYLFEYSVSKASFLARKRGGTCTTAPSDPCDEVLSRAKYLLTNNGFGFDLLANNCEDFAIYCKTGLLVISVTKLGSSGLANSMCALGSVVTLTLKVLRAGRSAGVAGAAGVASGASMASVAVAGLIPMALAGYGKYCFDRLVHDVGVRSDVRKVTVEQLRVIVEAMNGKLDDNDDNNSTE